jgi:hypothetical protein
MEIQKVSKPFHDEIGLPDKDATTQAYLDQVKATIRDNGWAMQAVFATEGSWQRFDYVYTIGMVERGCSAELMIAGLPYQKGAKVVNQIAMDMLNRSQMTPPSQWPLAGGFTLRAKMFVPRVGGELHVGVARAYYGQDVPVAQYVWPDTEHRYPWDEGWDSTLVQPVGNA